jgi:hypothetical protein
LLGFCAITAAALALCSDSSSDRFYSSISAFIRAYLACLSCSFFLCSSSDNLLLSGVESAGATVVLLVFGVTGAVVFPDDTLVVLALVAEVELEGVTVVFGAFALVEFVMEEDV